MDNRSYTVYRHTSPSGKMYVGITGLSVDDRWQNGRGYKSSRYFYFAIKKYGWENIKHEILLSGLTKEEAILAEEIFISYWDLTNPKRGYNILSGGALRAGNNNGFAGKKHTEESKRKMSEAHSDSNHPNYGKHLSKETRQRISEATKGRTFSPESLEKMSVSHIGSHSRPFKAVIATSMEDGSTQKFESIKKASVATGTSKGNICWCCKGKRNNAGGYQWRYA